MRFFAGLSCSAGYPEAPVSRWMIRANCSAGARSSCSSSGWCLVKAVWSCSFLLLQGAALSWAPALPPFLPALWFFQGLFWWWCGWLQVTQAQSRPPLAAPTAEAVQDPAKLSPSRGFLLQHHLARPLGCHHPMLQRCAKPFAAPSCALKNTLPKQFSLQLPSEQ